MELPRRLFVLGLLAAAVNGECLRDLRVLNVSSTSVGLAWEYDCDLDSVEVFKIDYVHKAYKACDDERRDRTKPSGFGTVEVTDQPAVVHNLNPYSEYSLEVRVILRAKAGRPESGVVTASTMFSIPQVRAQTSSIDYSYRNTETSLVFNWSPPPRVTECDKFFSDLGWFFYKLAGTNPWNKKDFFERELELTETILEMDGLQPYSDYIFLLFVTNSAKEYDETLYLKLEGRTLPSVPDPPAQISAEPTDYRTIHARWNPRIPKKGEVSHYEVRWKPATAVHYTAAAGLNVSNSLCSVEEVGTETTCFTLSDLEPDNYTLQVRTYNQGVPTPSPWSEPVHAQVGAEVEDSTVTLSHIFIISAVTVLLLILAIYVLYRFLNLRRRKEFDRVLTEELRKPPPILRPAAVQGNGRLSTSDSFRHYADDPLMERLNSSGGRSFHDPLPPLPGTEDIYADLLPKLEEEDNYLKPNPAPPRVQSKESLDEQGYLRPNFNRFQRLDTTGSDKDQSPSVIPPVSYLSGT